MFRNYFRIGLRNISRNKVSSTINISGLAIGFGLFTSWQAFVAVGLIVLLIALETVSFKAIKAAIANPVKSLRTE
jgi:hypothetical protein